MTPGSDTWIGILGGGQLGRMLAFEARRMGFYVINWTGGESTGAEALADLVLTDPFDSERAFHSFIDRSNVATVEFENIPGALLDAVSQHLPLMPSRRAISICQHREREKQFLEEHGIPCAKFCVVDSLDSLREALALLQGDAILKTAELGYDGKGQVGIARGQSSSEIEALWTDFDGRRAVLEEKVTLAGELSVIVARDRDGNVATYDPAENEHRNHILHLSIVPARLPKSLLDEARNIAVQVAEALNYVGVLGVEFFLDVDGRLLVNEMAPRPHNSGHHTLDACETSQFEQQLRAVCGLPLGSPHLIRPAVMWNLLGDLWPSSTQPPNWTPILKTPGAKLHIYGKSQARPGRKMGHVTFTGKTLEEAIERASICIEALTPS